MRSAEGGAVQLRVMNVFEDRIDTEDLMEMDFSPEDFKRFRLEVGDILLNEGQSLELVGRSAIYMGEVPGSCFTNTLVRFRPNEPITSDYPQIVFLGYLLTGRFQTIASLTVNIAHLGAGRFADMPFPLPPLAEQAEIVRQARTALDQIKTITLTIADTAEALRQLDQSILAKAFLGKLLPQDPRDEPASVLLERIRESRRSSSSSRPKQSPLRTRTASKPSASPQQRSILDLLRQAGHPMPVEQLRTASGLPGKAFFSRLREAIASGTIKEVVTDSNERHVEPAGRELDL